MALAWLCHEFARSNGDAPNFTAFIVDHGVREGSAVEASKVREALDDLQIKSKVLKIDWSTSPSSREAASAQEVAHSSNFETRARMMRFRALGQGCYDAGIDSLLVGHHLNDQVETVLVRLCVGYTGDGLRGILPEAQIPENEKLNRSPPNLEQGTYNDSHHHPKQQSDDIGAINVIRPLLDFTKEELIATCRDAGVEWFEDPTNANTSLTTRNTIRHLLAEDLLPKALRAERICQLATTVRAHLAHIDELSEAAFARAKVSLTPRLGLVTCEIDSSQRLAPLGDDALEHHVRAAFVRRLTLLVSPTENISLHSLHSAVDLLFGPQTFKTKADGGHWQKVACVAEVEIRQHIEEGETEPLRRFSLFRTKALQIRRHVPDLSIPLPQPQALVPDNLPGTELSQKPTDGISWTSWHLWDSRYWLRVGHRPQLSPSPSSQQLQTNQIKIHFLDQHIVTDTTKSLLGIQKHRDSLRWAIHGVLKSTSEQNSRRALQWTAPGIFLNRANGSEELIALPTLGWVRFSGGSKPNVSSYADKSLKHVRQEMKNQEWFVDWRYKHVDFPCGEEHIVKGDTSWTSASLRPAVRLPKKRKPEVSEPVDGPVIH
jgi:tRNA(Ile)-lysidine synthetase-like protein